MLISIKLNNHQEAKTVSVLFTKPNAEKCVLREIFIFEIFISLLCRMFLISDFSSHLYLNKDFGWQSTF